MDATSSSYSIETTILSAESLTLGGKKPLRGNPYVTISTLQDNYQCRTKICQDNPSNPAWNEKLTIDVPVHVKFLVMEVRCSTISGDKTIGVANVPVSDFVGDPNLPINYLHFLSYRLRDGYGDPNGIINFSVKVVKGFDYNQYSRNFKPAFKGAPKIDGFGYNNRGNCVPEPWYGTSLLGDHGTSSNAAVLGVPATWYSSSNLHVNF